MITDFICKLKNEDLQRWTALENRMRAIEINPTAFSAEETLQAVAAINRFGLELEQRLDLDPQRDIVISANGRIRYVEDD